MLEGPLLLVTQESLWRLGEAVPITMRPKTLRMLGPCGSVFYSRDPRASKPPSKPTAPGGGYLTFPSAEPSVRMGEGAVMGSVGLTALEDVGKYVRGDGN